MSSTSAIGDSGRFSGNKMSFSQTCNLLSQYVKEKRALGVSGNIDSRRPSTMNLFPVSGKQSAAATEDSSGCVGKTINLFPQLSGFNSSVNKRASPEPPTPQMTIFYGGQVLVFNDLPADKAKEIMDLASNFEASLKKRKVETTNSTPPSLVAVPVSAQNTKSNLNPTMNSNQNLNVAPKFVKNAIPAAMPNVSGNYSVHVELYDLSDGVFSTAIIKVLLGYMGYLNYYYQSFADVNTACNEPADLPIARKASLHRFLEKRKDRLVGKLPADVANGGSAKPLEGKAAWLGLNSLPVFQMQK